MRGIDVSTYQGEIDWPVVKASGVEFAIIRAGAGTTLDRHFHRNMKGAIAAGVAVGAYWFSYAFTVPMAVNEARRFLQALSPYSGQVEFPVCFDWEYSSDRYARQNGVIATKALITDMAIAFLSELEDAGWYAMNYLNIDYYLHKFDMERMKSFDVWLADYAGSPRFPCGIQQTSSTGRISGIYGNVDTDIAYKDYPRIMRRAGLNGFAATSEPEPPQPEPEEISVGKWVRVNPGSRTYSGEKLAPFVYAEVFKVMELRGNRAVIGLDSAVTAAVHVTDLRLV